MPPTRLRLIVAVNPAAAFGRTRGVADRAVSELRRAGHDVRVCVEADYAELRVSVLSAVAAGADALVVVGGDGMVSLGVGIIGAARPDDPARALPLGIIPSGTGNDLARGLGIPVDDADAAIDTMLAALRRPVRRIDVGRITRASGQETWFAGVLSGGFDALVNERANALRWPRGRHRYTLALLLELAGLTAREYVIEIDGVVRTQRATLVAVANNRSFGGGMLVAPDARLDDGQFDVVTLDPVGRAGLLRIFPKVFTGAHLNDPRVTVTRARRVRIEVAGVVGYADGERVDFFPLDIELVPGAIGILA